MTDPEGDRRLSTMACATMQFPQDAPQKKSP